MATLAPAHRRSPMATSGRSQRRWVRYAPGFFGFSAVTMVAGWWLTHPLIYLAGLSLAVLWATHSPLTARWRLALVAVVLVVGLGGPWLAVRLAYREVGLEPYGRVSAEGSDHVASAEGFTVLADARGVFAIDATGAEAWHVDSSLSEIWALEDGGAVLTDRQQFLHVNADGAALTWSFTAAPPLGGIVAEGGGVVVVQACADVADAAPCTWTGLDLADGSARWTASGAPTAAWPLPDLDETNADSPLANSGTSLFAVATDSGEVEVREAATGEVVDVLPARAEALLVGDGVLVLERGSECSIELRRGGAEVWATDQPCGAWPPLDTEEFRPTDWRYRSIAGLGARVGDSWWSAPAVADGAGPVLDLRTGDIRMVVEAQRSLGAGVEVEERDGRVTVRDAVEGTRLWSARAPGDVWSTWAEGEVVVVERDAPLLLGEVFAPAGRGDDVVEVYDARTGRLLGRQRASGHIEIAGDRVVVALDDHGREVRVLGP